MEINEDQMTQKYRSQGLPITCEAELEGHQRPITSIALERSGVRMATASWDTDIRLWDFNGMNKSMNSFRILTPIENHVIQNITYNADEQEILVVAASAQPMIISREGKDLVECLKGDQYLRDLKNTKGHTSMCYDGCYHPHESHLFLTCGQDGTMRLWDRHRPLWGLEQKQKQADVIICNSQGKKISVYCCNYLKQGRMMVGCCSDATMKCYDVKSYYGRPNIQFNDIHQKNTLITKVMGFNDGFRILTRAQDHTLKLWDARNPKQVVKVWDNLENNNAGCKIALSPDEKFILTGTSYNRDTEKQGSVRIIDSTTLEETVNLNLGEVGATDIAWHPVLNQIFVGQTDGSCLGLFDPTLSKKGIVSCLSKKERTYAPVEFSNAMIIKTPHALPLFKDDPINKKRQYEKMRQDKTQTKEPLRPPPIKGTEGRQGGPTTVTQHIMQVAHKKDNIFEDSQQALQKLDALTKQGPNLVNSAYQNTQPEIKFDKDTPDFDEFKLLSSLTKICPNCGLKLCVCHEDPINRK